MAVIHDDALLIFEILEPDRVVLENFGCLRGEGFVVAFPLTICELMMIVNVIFK